MFRVVPFQVEHLNVLLNEPLNADIRSWMDPAQAERLEGHTLLKDDEILMCGGSAVLWKNRAQVWSVWGEKTKKHYVGVIRFLKRYFELLPFERLEMCVPVTNLRAQRRALVLGFKLECARAEKYLPNGEDCALFALVKRGS